MFINTGNKYYGSNVFVYFVSLYLWLNIIKVCYQLTSLIAWHLPGLC